MPRNSLGLAGVMAATVAAMSAQADYLDTIGYSDLQARHGTNLASGAGVTVAQVEAFPQGTSDYLANTNDFPDKTFTGRVGAIDTSGSVSSGVTSYPVTISMDAAPENLYPNMSASASIITDTKDDVVMVPNAAVQTQNNQSTVRVMKNGEVRQVEVETGLSNDTNTEIISGIKEGDTVVTGQTGSASGSSPATSSPFGIGSGFRQGGNVRIGR